MRRTWYRLGTLVAGILIGVAAYALDGPWWLYLVAMALFLGGMLSFSIDAGADRSGYGKWGDDSRGDGGGGGL